MNKQFRQLTAILAVAGLVACASTPTTNYRPILDTKGGVDSAKFEQDLVECQAYGRQVSVAGETASGALEGALVGGAIGAAVGAIAGDPGTGAAIGAAWGGIESAALDADDAVDRQKTVIDSCLKQRGHSVLG